MGHRDLEVTYLRPTVRRRERSLVAGNSSRRATRPPGTDHAGPQSPCMTATSPGHRRVRRPVQPAAPRALSVTRLWCRGRPPVGRPGPGCGVTARCGQRRFRLKKTRGCMHESRRMPSAAATAACRPSLAGGALPGAHRRAPIADAPRGPYSYSHPSRPNVARHTASKAKRAATTTALVRTRGRSWTRATTTKNGA